MLPLWLPPGFLFILPVTAIFFVVRILPSFGAFYLSFTDYSGLEAPRWVGVANYLEAFSNPIFLKALLNTTLYSVGVIVPSTLIGLGIALLLADTLPFRSLFRTLFYLPVVVSFVSIAMIWSYLLNAQFGVVNYALSLVSLPKIAWLESETTALPTLIVIGIWKNLGYTTVIYIAGLQGVPGELHEAAKVDGGNAWQRFRDVTWPLLTPVTLFLFLMTGIAAFQAFDQVLVLTAGGPANATTTVVLEAYRNAFQFLRFGYAAAMSFALFVVIGTLGLTMIILRERSASNRRAA